MSYKVGIVSGKFRILHNGHKEVIKKASKEDIDKLVVIIHTNEKYVRYSTINSLTSALEQILEETKKPYEIIKTDQIFNTLSQWEDFIITTIGHKSILMFNSKEDYPNEKLDNKYIKCAQYEGVSATLIEDKLLNNIYDENIVDEFVNKIKL